jgi:AAA domain
MSRGDGLAKLRQALEDHGCAINGTNAQCPAHEDRAPSLSIGQGDKGAAVLNCKAGCSFDEVLEALGMSAADLFDEPRGSDPGRPQVVAEYRYTDQAGSLLYTVRRYEPGFNGERKTFRPFLPSGRAGLGKARVLYRLPQLIEAVLAGRTVYITEGEKDADAIVRAGGAATCNVGGALKWRGQTYNRYLAGATVVIVADRDEPGRTHAADVAGSLADIADSVTIVEAAEGKDAADHLAAGYSLAELVPAGADERGDPLAWAHILDWHQAFGAKPDHVEWLLEPLLERGTGNAWFGKPSAGKSLIALEIAAALAAGRPVLGAAAQDPMTVLYVDAENAANGVVERLQAFGYGPGDLKRLVYSSFPDLPALDTPAGGLFLLSAAEAHDPVLVIIDTTSRVIAGKENDADTFLQLYRHALVPLKRRGVTVLRLDHPGKDVDRGQRGSSAKDGDVDTVWLVDQISQTGINLERRKSRSGHGSGALYLVRRFEPLRHEPGGTGVPPGVADVLEALARLQAPERITNREAQELLRDVGERFRNADIAQALRIRRERRGTTPRTDAPGTPGNAGTEGSGQAFPDPPPRSGGTGNGPFPEQETAPAPGKPGTCRGEGCNARPAGGAEYCQACRLAAGLRTEAAQ